MIADPDQVLSVTLLTQQLKSCVETTFPRVSVAGEVADLTVSGSKHIYLTLRDANAQIRGTIWRSTAERIRFQLRDGLEVVCRGPIQIYPPRGTYQLIIQSVEPVGIGAQQLAFQQLFQKLKAEGLFDPQRKRPLPTFAQRIGIVTSPTGAAIHDVIQVIRRRWRDVELLIFPSQVQGPLAPGQVVAAIQAANRIRPAPDALIVARGGGSQDDIACFNDERVVRAVASCRVPVISAVGHEIDVTLCDLVADRRALTPSEAGELVVPDGWAYAQRLDQSATQLRLALQRRADLAQQRLAALARLPIFRRPLDRIRLAWQHCDQTSDRLARGLWNTLHRHQSRTEELAARLQAISPIQVLSRGYSVTKDSRNRLLTDARRVAPGDSVETLLARGKFVSRVEHVTTDNSLPSRRGLSNDED